ncbi:MAG: phospho-N-acetylmuramoyl-pentapeptide-transferase [Ruminococcaceae bacterium]|nr:phospho-N-acetylmuramoyl-pentapeptide-transferase [Oscillospiraceae bacterium]
MTTDSELMLTFLTALPAALLLTMLLCRVIIPVLRKYKVGQHIFADYVQEHKGKEGTPTMGGICFILPLLILCVPYFVFQSLTGNRELIPLALTICLGVANAMIGFVDDYTKLSHKENQGLASWQKFLLQILVAAAYLWAMAAFGGLDTVLTIHSFGFSVDLGIFYYVAALIVIVGMVNSTNLTDGIDGLASSVALVASMCLALVAFLLSDHDSVLISALMIGGMIGFLAFNYHPAKVFMGDTGSLFLGGILIGTGFMLDRPLLVLVLSAVFILDMLSSLIQIVSIRVFHRKVFGIAPVHHQFQKMHWTEEKIVYMFSLVGLIFGIVAVVLVICGLRVG